MSEILLKSKAKDIKDYTTVDFRYDLPEFKPDWAKLNADMKKLQFSKGLKQESETVSANDLVTISCKSDNPRFNKESVQIMVGKRLYDAAFERKLIGLNKNENAVIELTDTTVEVEVKSIIHTIVPELTDENVASWGLDGIDTVEKLRKYYFGRQVDNFRDDSEEADMVITNLFQSVAKDSHVETDPEEVEFSKAKMLKSIEKNGADMDDDGYDIKAMLSSLAENTVKAAAIGYEILKQSGKVLTDDDYKEAIRKRSDGYGISAEEAMEDYPVMDFAIEEYSGIFFDILEKYVGDVMKEEYYERYQEGPYDVAIIGAGPAGLSAALNFKLHNKKIIWFGSDELSDKVGKSEKIANYPGITKVSGADLNDMFRAQMRDAGLHLTDRMVSTISKTKKGFMLLADNEIFEAKQILMATGIVNAKGYPGEERLLGHGVSYCATCDGFLYKGKTIAVYCGAPRYEHEVEYLAELAAKVYLFVPYAECEIELPNVERMNVRIKEVCGEKKVEAMLLSDESTVEIDGIFILRNAIAPTSLLKGIEMEGPHIVVDRSQKTSIDGCYAAGDCTGRPYQIAKAVGEGNIAAHAMLENKNE